MQHNITYFRSFSLVLSFWLLAIPGLFAQSYWLQRAGSSSDDEGYSISTDANNNTYTTGYFTGTASFGATNITAAGISDIFITKTNSAGVFQWAERAGGGGDADRGLAIATDAGGNSYITGYYYGTATFGINSITSQGLQDIFVAKYDPNGNVLWVQTAGGTQSDIGNSIAVDNNGNVIITGQFAGTATFVGCPPLTSTTNNINVFTAKLNGANGNFMWAKSGVGPHTDRGLGVACDPSGNVYITGQFTDTITFDFPHFSNLFNAIFVVKYNSSGAEQWITTAGGGTYNIANAIAVDASSNVYITGNFTGTLTFFAQSNITLSNTYANRIFVAKYSPSATLLWDVADGSSNPVTSNSIALDASGNPYIIGNFDCIFNSYADHYGQGTFNSVGFWDIFTAEYSTSNGAWQWSRQIGGHGNNYGNGIAITPSANIFTAGSFDQDMIVPTDNNFFGCTSPYQYCPNHYCNSTYCSDNNYGSFGLFNTAGGLDIFIAKPFDLSRQTYDFYIRSGNVCNRPQEGVCISNSPNSTQCLDTLKFCGSGTLYAIPFECSTISPNYTYLWSNNSNGASITISSSGTYSVTQTSADGCYRSTYKIYVVIKTIPPPCISDNVVINTNSTNPKPIRVCDKTVILTGCNYSSDSAFYWTGPSLAPTHTVSISIVPYADSGYYCFNVVSKGGCTNQTCVWVAIDSDLPVINPHLMCLTCRHDSVFLCKGKFFTMFPYDKISNPDSNPSLCIPPQSAVTNKWMTDRDSVVTYASKTYCPDQNNFYPKDSGIWYRITDSVLRSNVCQKDKYKVTDSVYVVLYPQPVVNLSIRGGPSLCPGDMEWIKGTGNVNFTWSNNSTADSIYVGPGSYSISATVTNVYGCTTTQSASINISTFVMSTPTVTMNPSNGILCPNGSVQLTCSGGIFQKYQWYGPSGPLGGNTSIINVNTAGSYYCYVTDTLPCRLSKLTNTVLIENYATPYLALPPSTNICPGDSIILSVVASNGATILWLPPLSGNSLTQIIKTAGTYSVSVTACSITTVCTVTITASHPFASITVAPSASLCKPGDSAILTGAIGMAGYIWTPGNINGRVITVKTAHTYTLSASDIYGCIATASVTIYPPLTDSISSLENVSCLNGANATITLGVNGGNGVYTYSWSPVGGSSANISNLTAGSYSVTVIDGTGCTKTASVTITQPATLLVSTISSSTNVACFNARTGNANDSAYGGEPAYTYLWNPGGQTSLSATSLSAGSYTVTVTDLAGCVKTSSVTITQPLAISYKLLIDSATCLNNNGSISAAVSGGTSPYQYFWNPLGSTNASVSGLSIGTYSLAITDSHGCIDTLSSTILLHNNLKITISGADSLCKGTSTTLTVSGAASYLWSVGSTSDTITVAPPGTTNYWVKASTGICHDSIPLHVFVYHPLISFGNNYSICDGSYDSIGVTALFGKQPYTYTWNNGITGNIPGFFIKPDSSITYTVRISDGCGTVDSDYIPVTVKPQTHTSFYSIPDTISSGQVIKFFNTSNGATSYYWTFGDGGNSKLTDPSHIYTKWGNYQVILIGNNTDGCPDTSVRDIFVIPELLFPNVFTPGEGMNDVFYFTVQGATCFHANIYNRWGVLVYELTSATEGWPGTMHTPSGAQASDGVYYYILDYCDYKDVHHARDGFIQLIRNK